MTIEKLIFDISKVLEEFDHVESTIYKHSLTGDLYLLILDFCLVNKIEITGYNLEVFFSECKGINYLEVYDKATIYFGRISDDYRLGRLDKCKEFCKVYEIYFEMWKNKFPGQDLPLKT